jgi:hypothetical protein
MIKNILVRETIHTDSAHTLGCTLYTPCADILLAFLLAARASLTLEAGEVEPGTVGFPRAVPLERLATAFLFVAFSITSSLPLSTAWRINIRE